MEAVVRLLEGEPTVTVQVFWRGSELNLLRARDEPIGRFLQRLGLSCGKITGRQPGGDKKRAKKDKKRADGGAAPEAAEAQAAAPPPPRLLDAQGAQLADDALVGEALQRAAHVEIEGDRLPIVVNPPAIAKMEAFGKPLVGCPLTASLRCEFCRPDEFELRWLRQATAGAAPSGEVVGEGRVLWVPEDALGQTLTLRADARGAPLTSRARAVLRAGVVEPAPGGWPDRCISDFGPRAATAVRVVCFNILAVCYARTQSAVRDLYPYCPASALDMSYRQPLLGRELKQLDGDLVFLQECGYAVFHKCLLPLFGEQYAMRISLKASKVSEGCAMFVRRGAFEVLEERDALFRNFLRSSPELRRVFREVLAKWPDFVSSILPRMTTIFQLSVVRHVASGEVIVLANTHLFFHPNARHIRLLQVMCFAQLVQELREKHRGANGGRLPRAIVCGDLNSAPSSSAAQLLVRGEVPSDHADWDFFSQFAWRDDDDAVELQAEAEPGEGDDAVGGAAAEEGSEEGLEPLPEAEWAKGKGVTLRSPAGPLSDAYVGTGLAFTNYVQGFQATLDYILTGGAWRVRRVLPGPSEEELMPEGGLPSIRHPSDHLCIAADLEIVDG